MSTSAERIATYEDLCKVPDHLVAQIIHGQLITLPRPAPKHARAASIMGGKLVPTYDEGNNGPGGWWMLFEPELHLGPHILVPDLAGWRRERMPTLPDLEILFVVCPPLRLFQITASSPLRSIRLRSFSDGPLGFLSPISHFCTVDTLVFSTAASTA